VTQIDLPAGKPSGLKEAWRILKRVEGIRFITFTERDVARHRLVQDIITAYERDEGQVSDPNRNPSDKNPNGVR
jgi:phosphate starvation-inducible PhoH-like protein